MGIDFSCVSEGEREKEEGEREQSSTAAAAVGNQLFSVCQFAVALLVVVVVAGQWRVSHKQSEKQTKKQTDRERERDSNWKWK